MTGSVSPTEWEGTLVHRIDKIAQGSPQVLALKDGLGNSLNYTQMASRANVIAGALSDLHIGEGSKVGVLQEPSTDWICSMLAILRLGAVYVPLDPHVTTMRLAAIVKDCEPSAILTDNTNERDLPLLQSSSVKVNVSKLSSRSKDKAIPNISKDDSTMTILYTSGSTGTPKGTVMKHEIFRNHVETVTNAWISKINNIVSLQQSSFSFDMSLVQIFWPLCSGGSVYVVPQSDRGDSAAISNIISSENISITAATPSEYISWIRFGNSDVLRKSPWTLGISGGEKVTQNLAQVFQDLQKPGFRLMNCYGPTEITFFSHFSELSFADDNEWARTTASLASWSNYSTYIVDSNLRPVPAGVPGEVVIGGMGVASGYLNMKELTAQRFLPDNFASNDFIGQDWTTMHLTGDKGRLQPDGSLLLEGRIAGDTQIKLRGLRMDLQDIEASIISSSGGQILHTVVSVRKSQQADSEYLVGHVEFSPSYSIKNSDAFIRSLLVELPLPQYMRPSLIIPVERLPRTNSGKIDRLSVNALALPQQNQRDESSQKLNDTESKILQLWEDVLTKEVIGHFSVDTQSDFFQVGGSSLLLVQLQSRIKETFSIDLPLVQLFDVSTLGKMAAKIHTQQYPNDSSLALQVAPENVNGAFSRPPSDDGYVDLGAELTFPSSLAASTADDLIDWDEEVSLSSSLEGFTILGANEPRAVVFTGSTGFLGKAILQRLVATPSIEKVYCIAVRPNSPRSHPVFSSPKVLVYTGDQSLPLLGLSPSEATSIMSDADTIIHNGADVSFLKTYSSLRKTNLESTKQLAEWAVIHALQFHYISTSSVTYLSGQESYPSASVRNFKPPVNGSNGYIASKWASEVYLEKMNQEFGMPLVIHRPSSITGPGASETDVMSSVLKYSKMLHAIPKSDYIRGYFDFISLSKAADEIVESVRGGIEDVGTRYVFESGELQVETGSMKTSLEMQTGESVVELSIPEWVKRAEILGLNGMVAAFLNSAATQGLLMTKLIKD
jgi:hybrid polyketide synthase/nonribosomal peptide synthetase ACE1